MASVLTSDFLFPFTVTTCFTPRRTRENRILLYAVSAAGRVFRD